jgi:membrane protein
MLESEDTAAGPQSQAPPARWSLRLTAWVADLADTLRDWPWTATVSTLARRFREDRLGLSAGSLTFTTLIALVPLLTVMLAIFTAFPIFGHFQGALEKYFLHSLVPENIARPVLRALTQFAAKARGVGSAGLVMLGATALSMMMTIDHTLNAIWRVRRPRPFGQRVLIYWVGLTLGPLIVGISFSVTSYVVSASRGLVGNMPGGVEFIVNFFQFVLMAATIAGLFHYVPNTFVRWTHACAGGIFVAAALEAAKKGLAWYVNSMANFSAVYGAFATVPILLLWIYTGWLIVLFGAVIAAYAPSLQMRLARRPESAGDRFALALDLLDRLLAARMSGRRGLPLLRMARSLRQDPLQIEPVLDGLVDLGWVGRLDEAGEQRHVLLVDPPSQPLGPLVEALLLAPGPGTQALLRHSRLCELTLAQALAPDALAGADDLG